MNNGDLPAAPLSAEASRRIDDGVYIYIGLTKREAFAMAAMQGLLAGGADNDSGIGENTDTAVYYADALLAALEVGDE